MLAAVPLLANSLHEGHAGRSLPPAHEAVSERRSGEGSPRRRGRAGDGRSEARRAARSPAQGFVSDSMKVAFAFAVLAAMLASGCGSEDSAAPPATTSGAS